MFDIGMSEMAVIGVVALIVVGPKDLPGMFRKAGQFVGRMRAMARDFQTAMNDAADQAGVNDIKAGIEEATNIKDMGLDDITGGMKDYGASFKGQTSSTSAKSASKPAAKAAVAKPGVKKAAAKKAPAKKAVAKKAPAKKAST